MDCSEGRLEAERRLWGWLALLVSIYKCWVLITSVSGVYILIIRYQFWGSTCDFNIWTSLIENWVMNWLSCLSFPSVKRPVWRETIYPSSSLFSHITNCLTPVLHLIYLFIHLANIYWIAIHKWVAWVLGIQLSPLPSVWFYMIRTWRNSDALHSQCPHTAEASHWSVWCIPGLCGRSLAGQRNTAQQRQSCWKITALCLTLSSSTF